MGSAPASYPEPPWSLRHVTLGSILSFWEVAPEMFIGADDFVTATNAYLNGSIKPMTLDKVKEQYSDVEVQGLAPLRDFGDSDFEVVHGWLVYDPAGREAAEKTFRRSSGVGHWGRSLATTWHSRSYRATGIAENPGKLPVSTGDSSPMNRYESRKTGETVWEVAPGRFLWGTTEKDARDRFAKHGTAATFAEGSSIHKALDLAPSSVDKPDSEPAPLRRFRDKEGDQWFLLEDHLKLYCGTNEDEARDHPEDADEIAHAFVWAPFQEIDVDGNAFAEYDTPEELLSELQTTGETATDTQADTEHTPADEEPEEAPKMTTAVRKTPSFLHYVQDNYGRFWFEVYSNRYVLTDPDKGMSVPKQAGDAWKRFAARGYEEGNYGRRLDDITESHGPMVEKGFTEVEEVQAGFTQDDLLGSAISHDRCHCTKLDGEAEDAKRFKLDSNTFCVDCGKLRP
jgi:hypothetical protein